MRPITLADLQQLTPTYAHPHHPPVTRVYFVREPPPTPAQVVALYERMTELQWQISLAGKQVPAFSVYAWERELAAINQRLLRAAR